MIHRLDNWWPMGEATESFGDLLELISNSCLLVLSPWGPRASIIAPSLTLFRYSGEGRTRGLARQ